MMQNNKTYIIAEAGVNHNGSVKLAEELIIQAAQIGADAIKFQTFQVDKIVHPSASMAEYQKKTCDDGGQYKLLKELELSKHEFIYLKKVADQNNIQFLSTPFDLESLKFLIDLNLPYVKVSSGDLTYGPLLLKIAQSNKKVLVSTGMATIDEIRNALYVLAYGYKNVSSIPKSFNEIVEFCKNCDLKSFLLDKVILFHCTSEYPAPFNEINLNVLDTFKSEFGLSMGYSDHSLGFIVPNLAIAKGAKFIEKHFTLDNDLEGPDHKASLNVEQFAEMINQIRLTESILGSYEKKTTVSEQKNKPLVRRGIYAAQKISKNQVISENDICCLRPASGSSSIQFWDMIGTVSAQDHEKLDSL
jgi:N-acetylneuraminate synthase